MNNMQKTPLQEAVERAHALGRRAVIPFITAGFPDKDSFWTHPVSYTHLTLPTICSV